MMEVSYMATEKAPTYAALEKQLINKRRDRKKHRARKTFLFFYTQDRQLVEVKAMVFVSGINNDIL